MDGKKKPSNSRGIARARRSSPQTAPDATEIPMQSLSIQPQAQLAPPSAAPLAQLASAQAPPSAQLFPPPAQPVEIEQVPKEELTKISNLNPKLAPQGWQPGAVDVIPGISPGKVTSTSRIIKVWVNMIQFTQRIQDAGFYQYDLKLVKKGKDGQYHEVSQVNWREKILAVWKSLEEYFERTYGKKIWLGSDFARTIYCKEDLTDGPDNLLDVDLKFFRSGTEEELVAQIKRTKKIGENDLLLAQYVQKPMENLHHGKFVNAELVNLERVINVVVKTSSTLTTDSIGNNSFYANNPPTEGYKIGPGLVCKTGYSLLWSMGWHPFLTVDLSSAPFIMGKDVLDILKELFGPKAYDVLKWTKQDFDKAEDLLKGIQVKYRTTAVAPWTKKRVTGFSNKTPSQYTFDWEGKNSNVADYFREKYKKNIAYPNGPVLKVGREGGAAVPAEFCTVLPNQTYNKKLSDVQTAEMIKDTAKTPANRQTMIEEVIKICDFKNDVRLKTFGIGFDPDFGKQRMANLKELQVRVVEPPTIHYKGAQVVPKFDGNWSLRQYKFYEAGNNGELVKWTVLNTAASSSSKESVG